MNDTEDSPVHEWVQDYYGEVLKATEDLKTNACCAVGAPSHRVGAALLNIHDDVMSRFYGCGFPIPEAVPGALAHEQPGPRDRPGHPVRVVPGTLLHRAVGVCELLVNSAHHQAPADEPPAIRVSARAPDGVIEGIEAPAHGFCLGVQWHPEFLLSEGDRRLFAAFVAACREGRR